MEFHYRKFNFPDPRKENPEGFFRKYLRYAGYALGFAAVTVVETVWELIGSAIGIVAVLLFMVVAGLSFGACTQFFSSGVSMLLALIIGLAAAAVPIAISA